MISLNVRGINDFKKRRSVFRWLKKKEADICFLQETYSTPEVVAYWRHQWTGHMVFVHGTNHSRGTAILFKPGLDVKVQETFTDDTGRVIIISAVVQGTGFKLVNVYAPNSDSDKIKFFKYLKRRFTKHLKVSDNIIIGGDFNTVLDPKLDKKGGSQTQSTAQKETVRIIESLKEELGINEPWRRKHPMERRYTWKGKRGNEIIHSRLDLWFISDSLYDNIEKVEIIPSILSDHSAVYLHLKSIPKSDKGKGYWRLNNSFLSEEAYINGIRTGAEEWQAECEQFTDERMKWEYVKYKIRQFSIQYGIEKAKTKHDKEEELENTLNKLEKEEDSNNNPERAAWLTDRIANVRADLAELNRYKTEGLILRSRCQWYESGEKSNKYFLNLESRNKLKTTMSKLQRDDGTMTTDTKEILNMQKDFYENVYASKIKQTRQQIKDYLNQVAVPSLTEEEKTECEGPLTNEECLKAVKTFKNNKSPGNDGLTCEFYKKMWPVLGNQLVKALNYANEQGELSNTQKQAIITLLDKGKDRTLIQNWRPISLLNVDYKIASKALANRFIKFLPKLIHANQVGYVRNRNIMDNLRTISDILHFTKEEEVPGILMCIDFQKAFDSLEWVFLREVLGKFNFGNSFIGWVDTLYKQVTSCIRNDGYVSPDFKLGRGVRQGDPLSPYLFLLAVEILGCKIRQNDNICGIKVNSKETKCLQYADDTVGVLCDLQSAKHFVATVENFGKVSGLLLNKEKTEGMWLGSLRFSHSQPLGIKWPLKPIKILGVYFSYNLEECNHLNFETKINKCKSILHLWSQRDLTLQGRIQIVKTFIISQFVYTSSAITMPLQYVTDVERLIFRFIWKGKKDKIKRSVLQQTYQNGGLRAPSFEAMLAASNIKWVLKYLNRKASAWKDYFEFFMNKNGINLEALTQANYKANELEWNTVPSFYINVLRDWSRVSETKPMGKDNFLWYNQKIRKDRKQIFVKEMFECGIRYACDLFEEESGTLKPFQYWIDRGLPKKLFLHWAGIVSVVTEKRLYTHEHVTADTVEILCAGINICQVKTRSIYNFIMDQKLGTEVTEPKIKLLFEDGMDIDWSSIYKRALVNERISIHVFK